MDPGGHSLPESLVKGGKSKERSKVIVNTDQRPVSPPCVSGNGPVPTLDSRKGVWGWGRDPTCGLSPGQRQAGGKPSEPDNVLAPVFQGGLSGCSQGRLGRLPQAHLLARRLCRQVWASLSPLPHL